MESHEETVRQAMEDAGAGLNSGHRLLEYDRGTRRLQAVRPDGRDDRDKILIKPQDTIVSCRCPPRKEEDKLAADHAGVSTSPEEMVRRLVGEGPRGMENGIDVLRFNPLTKRLELRDGRGRDQSEMITNPPEKLIETQCVEDQSPQSRDSARKEGRAGR